MLETPPSQREGISVSEKDVATLNNYAEEKLQETTQDRKRTRLNSSHVRTSRMPSSA